MKPLLVKELPDALPLKKIIGPSFIILGLGLGSGEIILWPYLTSHFGMGIIWGAVLGLTFQFFMNMEIEISKEAIAE
ncbi:Nramp family divalent metal transporter, partial [Patescibacteria group bacterium]|nr:Nramp family divalent metal transporter [Patescibacteria group bacterium]